MVLLFFSLEVLWFNFKVLVYVSPSSMVLTIMTSFGSGLDLKNACVKGLFPEKKCWKAAKAPRVGYHRQSSGHQGRDLGGDCRVQHHSFS